MGGPSPQTVALAQGGAQRGCGFLWSPEVADGYTTKIRLPVLVTAGTCRTNPGPVGSPTAGRSPLTATLSPLHSESCGHGPRREEEGVTANCLYLAPHGDPTLCPHILSPKEGYTRVPQIGRHSWGSILFFRGRGFRYRCSCHLE